MVVELPAEAYRLGGEAGWESELRSMQSARFVAAAVMARRSCWTDLFVEASRRDRAIDAFAKERVAVVRSLDLPEGAVRVTVTTATGDTRLSCDVAPGDPHNPMTTQQLVDKARRCIEGSRLDGHFDVERLTNLSAESSIAALVGDLRAP